ncbi:MAG: UvrB/UvrC motif-containing protein [bacterium]
MKSRKCSLCGRREATLRVRQVDKDGASDLDICAECARIRGFTEARQIKANACEILDDMKKSVSESDGALVCPGCGLTFAEFKRKGRLGCARCYLAFEEQLRPLVQRLQGAAQHVGRAAKAGRRRAREQMAVVRLRAELEAAIVAEDYEQAARLRDELGRAEKDARR